jgi:hypothetical protein
MQLSSTLYLPYLHNMFRPKRPSSGALKLFCWNWGTIYTFYNSNSIVNYNSPLCAACVGDRRACKGPSTLLVLARQKLTVAGKSGSGADEVIMMMENLVKWRLAGETEVLGENPPQRHFVHHKSHLTIPRIEPGPPRWEASDWPLELWRGHPVM